MLKNFAAALLATSLIAAPAFAQTNDTGKAAAPAMQSQSAPAPQAPTAAKTSVKHHAAVKHSKKHHMSRLRGATHQARHMKLTKAHQASVAKAAKRS